MTPDGRSTAAGRAASTADPRTAGLAPTPPAGTETPKGNLAPPWLLVVARGQRQLAAQLEALFRGDARVRVIEDRRDERTLLPRVGTAVPSKIPPRGRRGAGAGRPGRPRGGEGDRLS